MKRIIVMAALLALVATTGSAQQTISINADMQRGLNSLGHELGGLIYRSEIQSYEDIREQAVPLIVGVGVALGTAVALAEIYVNIVKGFCGDVGVVDCSAVWHENHGHDPIPERSHKHKHTHDDGDDHHDEDGDDEHRHRHL